MRGVIATIILLALVSCAKHPLTYMEGAAGPTALPVQTLAWGFTLISLAVSVIIAGLMLYAIRRGLLAAKSDVSGVVRDLDGLRWIYWGVGLSVPVLVAMAIWSFLVTRSVSAPTREAAVQIDITAHQWWWEVEYQSGEPATSFKSANELVIPAGEPIFLRATSADVIHNFWAPKLGPKMDMIPGKWNEIWLQADELGVYTGQCAEFCGVEHAKMGFRVTVMPKEDFAQWRQHMLEPNQAVEATDGQRLFAQICSACHTIRGAGARGVVGPDLTHFANRQTIAAGVLPNTKAGRDAWLANTQTIKPGAMMPLVPLSDSERNKLVAYLGELD